jgi:hypothetical protein
MPRPSSKQVAKILATSKDKDIDIRIALVTEGFTRDRFCELVLKDRTHEDI